MEFAKISDIDIENEKTWQNRIFLTFDLDWCIDGVLEYTLDILEKYDVKATFFITHKTSLLDRIRKNPNFELGIHPNFNPLLNGDYSLGKDYKEVILRIKEIVPEARAVRSHSQTINTPILSFLDEIGFLYCCNTFIPFSSKIILKPYRLWTNKLIKVPYFWEDDVHMIYKWKWDINKYLKYDGLKVFDFHPIHIFLNCENIHRYEKIKKYLKDYKILKENKNKINYGVCNFLIDLIEGVNNHENCNNW